MSPYYLKRWSTLVRLRDNHKCYMCEKLDKHDMHAHHIYPKSVYPEKAYELTNGVCLCGDCHLRIVHTSWGKNPSWLKWTGFFKRWVRRVANKRFNEEYQNKIIRRKPNNESR
jgi:5-methylcytosine-specific restriction endonuclease McrA